MRHKSILLTSIFVVCSLLGFSQRKKITDVLNLPEDTKIFAYGVTTNTNSGLLGGFVLRHSKNIDSKEGNTINRYVALEAVNVKHPKEYGLVTGVGSQVVFGKKNYLLSLRPEYGRERYFFRKNNDEGIGLSGILAGGPSVGLQKPYYIRYSKIGSTEAPVTVPFDANIHQINQITGSANIWKGFFKGTKVIPGLHLKAAINLDLTTFGDNVTGIEMGVTSEYFFKEPEIMANELSKNNQFFSAVYLTLYLGNKKTKQQQPK